MSDDSATTDSANDGSDKADAGDGVFIAPQRDFLASIVVFLVALPLCMGIAIASGVPVSRGLITGIVGGIIVGCFSGAPLQVSGPAAGLTVIVLDIVSHIGLEALGLAVLVGGLLQFAAGMLRWGQWFRAVSPAVIQGMLAGIGVLIFSSQFHVMVDDTPRKNGVENLLAIPEAVAHGLPLPNWRTREERVARTELLKQIGLLHEEQEEIHEDIADHFSETAADDTPLEPILERQRTLTDRFVNEIEPHLDELDLRTDSRDLHAAVLAADAASKRALSALANGETEQLRETQEEAVAELQVVLTHLTDHRWAGKIGLLTIALLVLWQVGVPQKVRMVPGPLVAVVGTTVVTGLFALPVIFVEVPDNLLDEVHTPTMVVVQSSNLAAIVKFGVVIAIIASAETLLCATAVDRMHTGPRTNYDRELTAQGVGNVICGCLGALPMTGVIVRSAANVQAGGKTRLSAILHGIWLLVFVAFLSAFLRLIPTACLGAILVYTGWKLMNFKAIGKLAEYGWGEVFVYAATVITIVATDLLTGVVTGIVLAAAKLLMRFSYMETDLEIESEKRATLTIRGSATFLRLPVLAQELERVPKGAELHVDFERLAYIDHACLDLLTNWASQHEQLGGTLVIDWATLHTNFRSAPGKSDSGTA